VNAPIVAGIDGVGVAETDVELLAVVDMELRVEDRELETLLLGRLRLLNKEVVTELRVLDTDVLEIEATGTK
jgi:hypothetical protein